MVKSEIDKNYEGTIKCFKSLEDTPRKYVAELRVMRKGLKMLKGDL